MSRDTHKTELKTLGYVLRRTNYGEADRILNLITPEGKFAVIARGVRREKSKLAGGVEMLTLSEYNIHQGKGEFGIVTGVKMRQHYGAIVKDFTRMELAAMILKRVARAADSADSVEYFDLVDICLKELNLGMDLSLIKGWFLLNLARVMGEEVNLYRDVDGKKLSAEQCYNWVGVEAAFACDPCGEYGVEEIKMLRLMLTNRLNVVKRVRLEQKTLDKVSRFCDIIGE